MIWCWEITCQSWPRGVHPEWHSAMDLCPGVAGCRLPALQPFQGEVPTGRFQVFQSLTSQLPPAMARSSWRGTPPGWGSWTGSWGRSACSRSATTPSWTRSSSRKENCNCIENLKPRVAMPMIQGYNVDPEKPWCAPYAWSEPTYTKKVFLTFSLTYTNQLREKQKAWAEQASSK